MVWIKGTCTADRDTLRRILRNPALYHYRSLNIHRKWSIPSHTTLAGLARVIKNELVPEPLQPGFVVGFELPPLDNPQLVDELEWRDKDNDNAVRTAQEQRDQTLRWFIRPAPGAEELERRIEQEAQARQEEGRQRWAEAHREAVAAVEQNRNRIAQALAASAAAPPTRWEPGRYQPEPEPEPEPVEPVWLQAAASSSACAAAA